jgi:hypothetical protein
VRAGKARSRAVRSRPLSAIGLRAGRLGGSTVGGSDRVRVWDCQGAVATGHRGAQRGVVRRQAGGPEGAGCRCQRRRRQKGRRSTRAGQSQSEEDARRGRHEENEAAPQKKGQFLLVRGRRKKKIPPVSTYLLSASSQRKLLDERYLFSIGLR